jgi:hypothetical protein
MGDADYFTLNEFYATTDLSAPFVICSEYIAPYDNLTIMASQPSALGWADYTATATGTDGYTTPLLGDYWQSTASMYTDIAYVRTPYWYFFDDVNGFNMSYSGDYNCCNGTFFGQFCNGTALTNTTGCNAVRQSYNTICHNPIGTWYWCASGTYLPTTLHNKEGFLSDVPSSQATVFYKCSNYSLTVQPWTTETQKRAINTVHYSYNLNTLIIYDEEMRDMLVHVDGDSDIVIECPASCEIQLPHNWTTSQVYITVLHNNDILLKATFNYVRNIVCQVANCFFCNENFKSFDCMATGMKAFFIVVIVFAGAAGVVLLGCMTHCMITGFRASNITTPVVMCLLIVGGMGCDTNVIVGREVMTCTETLNTVSCVMNTNALITLTHLHSKACLTILTEKEDMVLGHINITYDGLLALAPTAFMYDTANWKPLKTSSKYCANSQFCTASQNCGTQDFNGSPNAFGAIMGPATKFPGVNVCSDSCGCAGCNCFYCAEACTYSRFAIEPIPTLFQVRRILPGFLKPLITYSSNLPDNVTLESVGVPSGDVLLTGDGVTLTYFGSGTMDVYNGVEKLIIAQGEAWFADASEVNNPVAGRVGDIQANSVEALANPSPSSFRIAKDICSVYYSDSTANYVCTNPGVTGLGGWTKLPTSVGDTVWRLIDGNTMEGILLNPASTNLGMNLQGNYKLVVKKSQVCPVLQFQGLAGFWGTNAPATIVLVGHSSCLPGYCVLTVDSNTVVLGQSSLFIPAEDASLSVSFHASQQHVKFQLHCRSLAQTTTVEVEGDLDDPVPVQPDLPPIPAQGFNHWFDDLSIGAKFGMFFGVIMVSLIAIALLIALDWWINPKLKDFVENRYKKLPESEPEDQVSSDSGDTLSDSTVIRKRYGPNTILL